MTPRAPAPEVALRLLRERFLNRTDVVSIGAPWGKPCPIHPGGTLDDLLLGHVFGDAVPATKVSYRNRRGTAAMRGRFRVGSYCPALDDTTRWLCIDFDGPGHADPLEDPQGAAIAAVVAFEAAGIPLYLERSGSAMGWHLWCFFDPPLPATKARALGHALAPRDQPLAGRPGVFADPRLARGIEVFPKQDKLRRRGRAGFGSPVWLPWWSGAPEGGNTFVRRRGDGDTSPRSGAPTTPTPAASSGAPPPPAHATSSGAPRQPRRRPSIYIRPDEHAVVDDAIAALSRVDGVYQRGPVLVHIVNHDGPLSGVVHPAGSMLIFPLGGAGVRDRLTLAAEWVELKETSDGTMERLAHPPAWLAPEVEARKQWPGVPHLEGVVDSPVLRPDGTLLERPGYDPRSGLFFAPNTQYPAMPANPTQQQAAAAAVELLDVVVDFPFKSDAHRAAWLAGVLTPLARFAYRGPSPLFVIDANVRSAGKSLLADVIGEIVAGREMARTPQAPDEGEEIKRITAIAVDGTRFVLIDNINRPLGSGALDAVLTGTMWSNRILGKTENVHVPLLTVWYATGNNITFQGDTARRCLHVRLDSDLEKPDLRDGFQHKRLRSWAHNERPRLVAAALTLLRAYCVAGRPAMPVKPWGSFEGWSDLVRNAIVWAGQPDPGETRAELDEVDSDARAVVDLIAGWLELPNQWGTTGCTVARALEALHDDATGRRCSRLRAALGELCPHPPGQLPTARKVGNALRRFRGRVVEGRKIQTRVLDGNNLWFVQRVGDAATQVVNSQSTAQLSLLDGGNHSQESDP